MRQGWNERSVKAGEIDLNSRGPMRWFYIWAWMIILRLRKIRGGEHARFDFGRIRNAFVNTEKLGEIWKEEKNLKLENKPSLWRCIYKCHKKRYIFIGLWKIIWAVATWMGGYYILKIFLEWIRNDIENTLKGHIIALSLLLSGIISTISINQLYIDSSSVGIQLRASLSGLVYSKLMCTSSNLESGGGSSIVNLFSMDIPTVASAAVEFHYLWSAFFEVIVIVALSFFEIGVAAIAPLIVIVLLLPIQFYTGMIIGKLHKRSSEISSKKTHIISEFLTAIKLVKFYAWERNFEGIISDIRSKENSTLRQSSVWKSLGYTLVFVAPVICTVTALALYVGLGRDIDVSTTFVILSLLNTLRYPLLNLPSSIRAILSARISINQISKYLLSPEVQLHVLRDPPPDQPNLVFSFKEASFLWEGAPPNPYIRDITLSLECGKILAVTGDVGSGKSSLLYSIIGQTSLIKGEFEIYAHTSYVPQEAWIMGGQTLRENILFGNNYQYDRYNKILQICGLKRDIACMESEDHTIIAERGANLSGGQKQRVSLARAAYSNSRIVLLDSPLSALDQSVGTFIFDNCIKKFLAETEKRAVVFVTHQLHQLEEVDQILVMKEGRIHKMGTYSELWEDQEFRNMMEKHISIEDTEDSSDGDTNEPPEHESSDETQAQTKQSSDIKPASNVHITIKDVMGESESVIAKGKRGYVKRSKSSSGYLDSGVKTSNGKERSPSNDIIIPNSFSVSSRSQLINPLSGNLMRLPESKIRKLYEAGNVTIVSRDDNSIRNIVSVIKRNEMTISSFMDFMGEGDVNDDDDGDSHNRKSHQTDSLGNKLGTINYYKYLKVSHGVVVGILIIVLFFVVHAIRLLSDYWLKFWTADTFRRPDSFYLWIYGGAFAVLFGVGSFMRAYYMFLELMHKAEIFHDSVFKTISHATQSFFDITPLALTITVFSKHQVTIDNLIPDNLLQILQYIPLALGAIVIPIILVPLCYVPIIVLLVGCLATCQIASGAEKLLKKMDAATKPRLMSHVITSAEGLASIRAYSSQHCFISMNLNNVDRSNKVIYASCIVRSCISFTTDIFTSLIVYSTALFLVLFYDGYSSTHPTRGSPGYADFISEVASNAGLALSNSLQLLVFLQWTIRLIGEMNDQISSVGQLLHFSSPVIPQEAPREIPEALPKTTWPSKGEIVFENVYLRYQEGGIDVLKDVSFHVNPKEKVGLVGRTGSGKSTLLVALFRMVELYKGRIIIDGVDISKIGLKDLRQSIAIIPQESIIFSGKIRDNLDPFKLRTDDEIWQALKGVNLDSLVGSFPAKLETEILDNGSTYSLGQRQLFCIARAMLSDAKILVLDEASSALDSETDKVVQTVLRKCFSDVTILTIAHRLNTIIDADKVLVMDSGVLKEFDEPITLLNDTSSEFSKLVNRAGKSAAERLTNDAQKAHNERIKDKNSEDSSSIQKTNDIHNENHLHSEQPPPQGPAV